MVDGLRQMLLLRAELASHHDHSWVEVPDMQQ